MLTALDPLYDRVVERRHLPLLLALPRFEVHEASEPLDRVRMQKGIFLLEQRGPEEWRDLYAFRPYDWGPYSDTLTSDVRDLVQENLLEKEEWMYRRHHGYRTSLFGEHEVGRTLESLPEAHVDFIRRVRSFVTTRSFRRLLQDVYAEFPDFARASRFTG